MIRIFKRLTLYQILVIFILVVGIVLFGLNLYFDEKQRLIDNCKYSGYFAGHYELCSKILFSEESQINKTKDSQPNVNSTRKDTLFPEIYNSNGD